MNVINFTCKISIIFCYFLEILLKFLFLDDVAVHLTVHVVHPAGLDGHQVRVLPDLQVDAVRHRPKGVVRGPGLLVQGQRVHPHLVVRGYVVVADMCAGVVVGLPQVVGVHRDVPAVVILGADVRRRRNHHGLLQHLFSKTTKRTLLKFMLFFANCDLDFSFKNKDEKVARLSLGHQNSFIFILNQVFFLLGQLHLSVDVHVE